MQSSMENGYNIKLKPINLTNETPAPKYELPGINDKYWKVEKKGNERTVEDKDEEDAVTKSDI